MRKRTLLLNSDYSPLTFLHERRVFKFLAVDKVDIISTWDDTIKILDKEIFFPSILKLKNQIKRSFRPITFSRHELLKRDNRTCQYCSRQLSNSEVTIDHLIPKSKGGKTSFLNCVISCQVCNSFKGSKTLEESGLKLLNTPKHPSNFNHNPFFDKLTCWHEDWNYYR